MAKTKVMTNTSKTLDVLIVGGQLEVDSFAYLGSRITSDAHRYGEAKTCLAMDMVAMVKLTKNLEKQGNKHKYKDTQGVYASWQVLESHGIKI